MKKEAKPIKRTDGLIFVGQLKIWLILIVLAVLVYGADKYFHLGFFTSKY